ncbi:MAG: preQ(1) synthase [Actinobacteria bacterium]|nr:preQ(1) synthase [Actinomycetota bacterium]
MSQTPAFGALGRKSEVRYDEPDAGVLETFANPHPGQDWAVSLDCYEFTSLCPVTGQPDFGRLLVTYVPDQLCVESKSMKLYLMGYRNHGAFHEDCVNRVASDLAARLAPVYLVVRGDFNPRGGIAIRPVALRKAGELSAEDERRCLYLLGLLDEPWGPGPSLPGSSRPPSPTRP